jgi:hypothetical protein
MSALIQYDLFKPIPNEHEVQDIKIAAIKESSDKVRKKLFCENGELKKKIYYLEERMQIIERALCQTYQKT